MRRWMSRVSFMAALVAAGCVFPVDIEVDHHDDDEGIRGSGHVVTEARSVRGFDAIRTAGAGRVVITRSGRESLNVSAEDNIIRHLRTEVVAGVLVLGPAPGADLSPTREIVYHVGASDMRGIEGSGAVSFDADLGNQPELEVTLSGACVARVEGVVQELRVTQSGVTGFEGLDLESRRAMVSTSGVSWANVWVTDRLEAWASGVSSIRYKGEPALYAHASGTSTIRPY